MRLDDIRESGNVEDRRGRRLRRGGAAVGGGAVLVAIVLSLLGAPPEVVDQVLQGGGGTIEEVEDPSQIDPAQAPTWSRMRRVLTTTEEVWSQLFSSSGQRYAPPKLIAFTDAVQSACGTADSAVGPFYCPLDQQIYLDLTFFDELAKKFGAPGDFAQAYVLAHEVGHHVQTLTGISERVHAQRSRVSKVEGNRLSVLQELQADCYAGVWAHHGLAREERLEPGDVEEGLRAANAIGDDTLQRRAQGHVVPDSFTHGSAAQRQQWFQRGFDTGRVDACDTFR